MRPETYPPPRQHLDRQSVSLVFFLAAIVTAFVLLLARLCFADTQTDASISPPNWQGWILIGWPVLTALSSLLVKVLDKTSWGHAFFSALAGLGIDLPKTLDAIKRMLSGTARTAAGIASKTMIVIALLTFTASSTSCTPAQAADIINTIAQLLAYAGNFISGAQAVWSVTISPFLRGDVKAKADAQFARGVQAVTDLVAATQEALAAARVANTPPPDVSQLVTNLQAAVLDLAKIVEMYAQPAMTSVRSGAAVSSLTRQAQVIAAWR